MGWLDTNALVSDGTVSVSSEEPTTAFGDLAVARNVPVVQIDAIYGLIAQDLVSVTESGGTATEVDAKFQVTCGVSANGRGSIRSRRAVRYRPGQGSLARFTARFDSANALPDSLQAAGFFTAENDLLFGYNGEDFGIRWSRDGALEIQTLTLTAAAGGPETATVTLAGAPFPVALSGLGTVQGDAWELSQATYTGWDVRQVDDTVIFVSQAAGDQTGSFTYSSTGISVGALAETAQGADLVTTWYPQAEWNADRADGTGLSGHVLDPSTLNVYAIQLTYLGAGPLRFYLEIPGRKQFLLVHTINFDESTPSLSDPNMHIGWISESLGSSGTSLTVEGASASGFQQGMTSAVRNPYSAKNSKAGVAALTAILVLRCGDSFNGKINQLSISPESVSAAADGAKPAEFTMFLNPTLGGTPNFQYVDQGGSIAEIDVSSTTITGGREIFNRSLAREGNFDRDVSNLNIRLNRGDVLALAIRPTAGSTDPTVSITWRED